MTQFDGMDYRSIASVPTKEDKALRVVAEGAALPETTVRAQSSLVRLHKRGRMLVASYEAIRFQRLDLFAVTLRQIGAHIARMHLEDAIDVIMKGDGNNNAAQSYKIGTKQMCIRDRAEPIDTNFDRHCSYPPHYYQICDEQTILAGFIIPKSRERIYVIFTK